MSKPNDGGPAFPITVHMPYKKGGWKQQLPGMSLRAWLAGTMQEDDRLVKCIRAMDDTALLLFASHPGVEREEWITETKILCGENVFVGKEEVEKVITRLRMEASAIARVRMMQADALIAELEKENP
jgi:hypothetical protein